MLGICILEILFINYEFYARRIDFLRKVCYNGKIRVYPVLFINSV